jgi:hypothetical protein
LGPAYVWFDHYDMYLEGHKGGYCCFDGKLPATAAGGVAGTKTTPASRERAPAATPGRTVMPAASSPRMYARGLTPIGAV